MNEGQQEEENIDHDQDAEEILAEDFIEIDHAGHCGAGGRASQIPREAGLLAQPGLAADLAGKFDAVILAEDSAGGGTVVAARVERLPATGQSRLQGLPATGRLRIQLYQREAPHAAAETPPLHYGSAPAVLPLPAIR